MLLVKSLCVVAALAVLSISLTACETMEGAGRDIEHAGESVQDAAD